MSIHTLEWVSRWSILSDIWAIMILWLKPFYNYVVVWNYNPRLELNESVLTKWHSFICTCKEVKWLPWDLILNFLVETRKLDFSSYGCLWNEFSDEPSTILVVIHVGWLLANSIKHFVQYGYFCKFCTSWWPIENIVFPTMFSWH